MLEPGGSIVFSNNFQRFRLDTGGLNGFSVLDITRETIPEDYARNPRIHQSFLLTRGA